MSIASSSQSPQMLRRAHDFKHFLWRCHAHRAAINGCLPEILATDGGVVRRLASMGTQIVFQEFEESRTASALVERIEGSVTPGLALVGYAMFEDREAVAILHTGRGANPGWLAFPDMGRTAQMLDESTLPDVVAQTPRLRLVTGARLSWKRRNFIVHAALEQRGSRFAASPAAFHILEHLESWTIEAAVDRRGVSERIDLLEPQADLTHRHLSPTRAEATFAIDTSVYRDARQRDATFWFRLTFDRNLFCLPEEWRHIWIEVQIQEPAGILR